LIDADAAAELLHVDGLESRALWLGHMKRPDHSQLIADIGKIPLDWRAILQEYESVRSYSFARLIDGLSSSPPPRSAGR